MRYNRAGDHYGVAGVLTNKNTLVAEARNIDTALVDPSTLIYTSDINEIGYDWKYFGATGFTVEEDLSYYVIDESNDTSKIVFHGFSGSGGGGVCSFTVNGVMKTIQMGTGYVDRVFFDLDNDVVHSSARNAWDLAFDGTSFGTAIRTNEEIGTKLWVYPNSDASSWSISASSLIENNLAISGVSVYPNPTSVNSFVEFNVTEVITAKVQLFSLQGQLLLDQSINCPIGINKVELDLKDIQNGLYHLVIVDPSNEYILYKRKLVKI